MATTRLGSATVIPLAARTGISIHSALPAHSTIHKLTSYSSTTKERSPLMLQDYLTGDIISSCSSNGFKSFPRHQCCPTATVSSLLKSRPKPKPQLVTHKSLRHSSAFHKVSVAVVKAVRSFPFNPSSSGKKPLHLTRSLSRRLLRKSFFWRRKDVNVAHESDGRWRSFYEFLQEQDQKPLPRENPLTASLGNDAMATRVSTSSSSSTSKSNGRKSCSCEGEFTADNGGSSESYGGVNDGGKNDIPSGNTVSEREGVTTGMESSTIPYAPELAKTWRPNEETEQFSPGSILDCPFKDDDVKEEEDNDDDDDKRVNSLFDHHTLIHVDGTKRKLMRKLTRFECQLAELKPLNLHKRMTTVIEHDSMSSDITNSPSSSSTRPHSETCSSSISSSSERECSEITRDPHELLSIVKERASSSPSINIGLISKSELLLLDFFEEKFESKDENPLEEMETVAEEWLRGEAKEMFGGWEVKECRNVYLKHMDGENGDWRNVVGEMKEEVGLELEDYIFTSLIDEVLLQLY